jgi:hypothetical protein
VTTESEVTWLEPSDTAYRVRYRDLAGGGRERTVAARQVFLCLGAVNTTELLLRCRDQHGTLPRFSPALGSGYSANGDFLALGVGTTPAFETTNGPTITTAVVYDEDRDGETPRLVLQDGGYSPQLSHLMPLMSPTRLTTLLPPPDPRGGTSRRGRAVAGPARTRRPSTDTRACHGRARTGGASTRRSPGMSRSQPPVRSPSSAGPETP